MIKHPNSPHSGCAPIGKAPDDEQAAAKPSEGERRIKHMGDPQGRCQTSLTERFYNPFCQCPTYEGNAGPCLSWELGGRDGCVYCDHMMQCHLQLAYAKLADAVEKCARVAEHGKAPHVAVAIRSIAKCLPTQSATPEEM